MKSRKRSRILPTWMMSSVTCVRHSQQQPSNCDMTDSDPRSGQLQSATKEHAKCEKCGATTRLDTGICVSCLLREGLEGGDEVSQAFYQSVLAEVDAPHKSWFLGNYDILEQIGCGGMGVIYLVRQRHSLLIVALKCVLNYSAV